jgi:uncharacterized protein (DUF305 family)
MSLSLSPSLLRLALLFGLLALPLAGCDDADPDGGENDVVDDQTDDPRAFVPANDLAYIDFLQPHHMDAVEMAEMVAERGERDDVQAFAQRIIDTQSAEIGVLRAAREDLAGSPDSPPVDNPHMEADMEEMTGLSGAALDEHFLENMLPHHADAVAVSHNALPNLDRQDMRDMAMDVIEVQSAEIGEILALMEGG